MESQLVMAFRHIAANDQFFAMKVLVDFGKYVKDVTEADLIERLDGPALVSLQKYADEMQRRRGVGQRRIKRKGGRP